MHQWGREQLLATAPLCHDGTNPRLTRHNFSSMDRKCASPLNSCTQAQSINLQPTSTSLCQPEKSSFKRHKIRPEWPSNSIKNAATQCVIEKSSEPPNTLIKKFYDITPLFWLVNDANSSPLERPVCSPTMLKRRDLSYSRNRQAKITDRSLWPFKNFSMNRHRH